MNATCRFRSSSLLLVLLASCTGVDAGPTVTTTEATLASRVPLPDAYLDRKGSRLLASSNEGKPLAEDPALVEASAFYDALGKPMSDETAPRTLQDWKATFGFPEPQPGEALQDFRDRTGVAVYYNANELGLGRELGCQRFVDGHDEKGQPIYGEACFVTNYGVRWRDGDHSLGYAAEGVNKKNTVCISYRPTLKPGGRDGYEVQFYVYGADDARQDWAQLDTMGPRPVPQVCTGCHGGTYDPNAELVRFARFLPAYPDLLTFVEGPDAAPGLTRAGQEERLRVLNETASRTPLTPLQRETIEGSYPAGVATPGQAFVPGWAPAGWRGSPDREDLYVNVVRPYCGTCHAADQIELDGRPQPSYDVFLSYEAFAAAPIAAYVCNGFSMPNAQATLARFWGEGAGVTVRDADGTPVDYAAPADALLAAFGLTRASCEGLADRSDCRERGGDAACGNAASGMVCGASGLCEPAR